MNSIGFLCIPRKSKTKPRMVFRMIHEKDSLLTMGKVWSAWTSWVPVCGSFCWDYPMQIANLNLFARLRFGQFLSLRLAFTRACGASMKRTLAHNTRRPASCPPDRCLAVLNVSCSPDFLLKPDMLRSEVFENKHLLE